MTENIKNIKADASRKELLQRARATMAAKRAAADGITAKERVNPQMNRVRANMAKRSEGRIKSADEFLAFVKELQAKAQEKKAADTESTTEE